MRINTNLTAMNTYTQYVKNNNAIAKSVEKLSSGYAINNAADNAAGLAISEKMRSQIRGLEQASTNSQDAISLVQTAEGSLNESTEILQRMRELAVQSSNDTNENKIDREALQDEFSQLQQELDDISSTTSFNKKSLLDGSLAKSTSKLTNMALEKSGLSIELGNVATGSYKFEVGVKQESAAIAGKQSNFTALSSDKSVVEIDAAGVTNNLEASSLANGSYDITAEYDEDNKKMVFTAAGDNGQTFTAELTESELKAGLNTGVTPETMTLNFGNGGATAFSFDITTKAQYNTDSNTVMNTLANTLTDKLSLSANGGVDEQAASYGIYASMTGAEDVKLQEGMESVTFSNGVKVNFDQLTTTDISTANGATMTEASATGTAADDGVAGTQIKYSNFAASADADITAGTMTFAGAADGTSGVTITATNGTKEYTATLSNEDLEALNTTAAESAAGTPDKIMKGVTFTADDGTSFTVDITNDITVPTANAATAAAITLDDTTASSFTSATAGTTTASTHASDNIFGAAASSFDVISESGNGLTFQVGANTGDELTIHIDKMDSNYLGVASASVTSHENAAKAIDTVDKAINQVSSQRAYLGAIQNRLDHKIANLNTSAENLTAAESQIRDVDMAKEMTNFTNANILSQAATAMLAQANSLPQNVLSLIG